jgi:DNA-binding NarL/FixJ family response regulator
MIRFFSTMSSSILVIGPADHLRTGLCTILANFPRVGQIVTADKFEQGLEAALLHQPALIIVDGGAQREFSCRSLPRLLGGYGRGRCIVIANGMEQAAAARAAGADAVLLNGFSTSTLRETVESLLAGSYHRQQATLLGSW